MPDAAVRLLAALALLLVYRPATKPEPVIATAPDQIVALASLDVGTKGRSGLLVSGDSWPVLVALDEAGPLRNRRPRPVRPDDDLGFQQQAASRFVFELHGVGIPAFNRGGGKQKSRTGLFG